MEEPGDLVGEVISVRIESGELSAEPKKLGFVRWLSALSG
jgi:hypothetical protein